MSSVGVNVPVQVTPPSALLMAESAPPASEISPLAKAVTASEKVMVSVDVSPTFNAVSDMTTLDITGAALSAVAASSRPNVLNVKVPFCDRYEASIQSAERAVLETRTSSAMPSKSLPAPSVPILKA